jgi:hypothetical protein
MLFFLLFKNNFVVYVVVKNVNLILQIKEKIDNLPIRRVFTSSSIVTEL